MRNEVFPERRHSDDQRDVVAWSERREYLKLAAEYRQYVEPDAKVSTGEVRPTFVLINGITKPRVPPTIEPGIENRESVLRATVASDQNVNHANSFVLINGITGRKK